VRHGLSLSGLEVLACLAESDDRRRRLARLAEDVGLSLSRVSRIADALAARGLLERHACPEDTRATNAWLTDAGQILLNEAREAHAAEVRRRFHDRLSAEELRTLGDVFARLTAPR
jgi:DNA-binding MarR family transcriptional regulator